MVVLELTVDITMRFVQLQTNKIPKISKENFQFQAPYLNHNGPISWSEEYDIHGVLQEWQYIPYLLEKSTLPK